MSAGRPVRLRETGFASDMTGLNRLRTALKIDRKLDKMKVALAIRHIDALEDALSELHGDYVTRKTG